MSPSADVTATGHANEYDHVLRPRPRKPQHSQVSQFRISSASDGDGHLTLTQPDGLSATTSGMTRYTLTTRSFASYR